MSTTMTKKLRKAGMHVELAGKVVDVICSMELDPMHTKLHVEHNQEVYYFCSTVCKNHFVSDPQKYVGESTN